jgi:glycosyltransferase involved in cell wall biosynthesis
MRVLFSFPHALGAPGIGWTAWNQVDGLARLGHDVHVVAASIARPVPANVRVTQTLAVRGKRVPHRAIGRDRAFAWHDARAARFAARGGYDIVHLWPTGPGRTAATARERGIAVVREAPNTHTEFAWRVVAEEVARLGLQGEVDTAHTANDRRLDMERADWSQATAILAPSDFVAQTFRDAGFADDRILRHQYGFRPGTRVARARTAAPAPLRAVYVGLGEPRKGLHYALDAWLRSEASKDGTLTVVGRMLPAYEALLADRLAHPSVRVVGFTHQVEAALAASDVLLLPTIEEGSALVTYEAQAMGCVPLVSTASGALVEDGVQGLFHEPRDVDALVSHLDLLSNDRAELARMSAAAIAHGPELTWDAAAHTLVRCYDAARDRATAGGAHAHAV